MNILTEHQGIWYPCEHTKASVINSYQLPGSRTHDLRKNTGTCKQNYLEGGEHILNIYYKLFLPEKHGCS